MDGTCANVSGAQGKADLSAIFKSDGLLLEQFIDLHFDKIPPPPLAIQVLGWTPLSAVKSGPVRGLGPNPSRKRKTRDFYGNSKAQEYNIIISDFLVPKMFP
jgi:hypothetical protein